MVGSPQDGRLMSNASRVRTAVARSQARGRVAIIIADNLKTHTAGGSLLVRRMVTELADQLSLVYTPAYDPDANRIEWRCAHLPPSRDAQSSSQGRVSRCSLMPESTLRPSPAPLLPCFVISAALLHLTSVLLTHRHLPHNQHQHCSLICFRSSTRVAATATGSTNM
jgi:hypothetical protein